MPIMKKWATISNSSGWLRESSWSYIGKIVRKYYMAKKDTFPRCQVMISQVKLSNEVLSSATLWNSGAKKFLVTYPFGIRMSQVNTKNETKKFIDLKLYIRMKDVEMPFAEYDVKFFLESANFTVNSIVQAIDKFPEDYRGAVKLNKYNL